MLAFSRPHYDSDFRHMSPDVWREPVRASITVSVVGDLPSSRHHREDG